MFTPELKFRVYQGTLLNFFRTLNSILYWLLGKLQRFHDKTDFYAVNITGVRVRVISNYPNSIQDLVPDQFTLIQQSHMHSN